MKYLIGKIGQKIIFNRESKDCDRSNTNGNVGTYTLLKLLFECNKDDEFYIISNNDLEEVENKWDNVFDYKNKNANEIGSFDKMFILAGLKEYENDIRLLEIINKNKSRYILLADDPRCLESVSEDERITRIPDAIGSQFATSFYIFKGEVVNAEHIHLERTICYKAKMQKSEKTRRIIAIANTSGEKYNRLKILINLIKDIDAIAVYGRANEQEIGLMKDKHKGEVKYNEMQDILKSSICSILIPIRKGWVTTKYIECLINNVCPIFYSDYNTSLLECNDFYIVSDDKSLRSVLNEIEKVDIQKKINHWYDIMVKPFEDGKKLSNEVISL